MAKRTTTRTRAAMRRDLFGELIEGMGALEASRRGKRTLRTHAVVFKPAPDLTAAELVQVRERLNLSRGVFAAYLRTNVRTLENWEQGRARPNAQAALLTHPGRRYSDTVEPNSGRSRQLLEWSDLTVEPNLFGSRVMRWPSPRVAVGWGHIIHADGQQNTQGHSRDRVPGRLARAA